MKVGPEAELLRGDRLMEQRRYEEALAAFERAIAEDSTNATAHLNVGVIHAMAGRMDAARRAFEDAIRLDPSNSRAHYNLGRVLARIGEPDRARQAFESAIEVDPGNMAARYGLARLFWDQGRCGAAIPQFDAYLAARPARVEARVERAICQAHQGAYAEARRGLEVGLEAAPDRTELLDALVRILAASPDPDVRDGPRALELARRLTDRVRRPETMESLAMAYAEVGRFSEAVRIQEEVVRAAESAGVTVILDHLRRNLRRYRDGRPARSPWPPTVFDM